MTSAREKGERTYAVQGEWHRRCALRGGIEDLVIILFTAFIRASTKSAGVISRGNIPRGSETICACRYAGKFATRRDDDSNFY